MDSRLYTFPLLLWFTTAATAADGTSALAAKCEPGGAIFSPGFTIRPYRLLAEKVGTDGEPIPGETVETIEPQVRVFNGIGGSLSGCLGQYFRLGGFLAFDSIDFQNEMHIPMGVQFAFYPGSQNTTVSIGLAFGFDVYGFVPEVTPQSTLDDTRTIGVAGIFSNPDRAKESWVLYLLSVGFDLGR